MLITGSRKHKSGRLIEILKQVRVLSFKREQFLAHSINTDYLWRRLRYRKGQTIPNFD